MFLWYYSKIHTTKLTVWTIWVYGSVVLNIFTSQPVSTIGRSFLLLRLKLCTYQAMTSHILLPGLWQLLLQFWFLWASKKKIMSFLSFCNFISCLVIPSGFIHAVAHASILIFKVNDIRSPSPPYQREFCPILFIHSPIQTQSLSCLSFVGHYKWTYKQLFTPLLAASESQTSLRWRGGKHGCRFVIGHSVFHCIHLF